MITLDVGKGINLDWFKASRRSSVKERTKCPDQKTRALVTVPSRVHMSLFNEARIGIGRPGGGGVAFASDLCSTRVEVVVEPAERSRKVISDHGNITHVLHAYMAAIEVTDLCVSITVIERANEHIGLGSNAALMLAVLVGVNHLVGEPLNTKEIRECLGWNYVESVPFSNLKVTRGYESGAASAVCLFGGLAVLSDSLVIVKTLAISDSHRVALMLPNRSYIRAAIGHDVSSEVKVFRESERFSHLASATAETAYFELIPAIDEENIDRIGDVIYDLNFQVGTYSTIRSRYSAKIYHLFEQIRDCGCSITGLSSTGPLVYAIGSEKSLHRVLAELTDEFESVVGIGKVSSGLEVVTENSTRTYEFGEDYVG